MNNTTEKDAVLDFETIGFQPDGMVLDLACVVFDPLQIETPPTFKELIDSAFYVKFDTTCQENNRIIDDNVVDWWLKQDENARGILDPSDIDVSVDCGIGEFLKWLQANGIDPYKSRLWSRGNEFDFGFLTDIIRKKIGSRDVYDVYPVRFWNVRDIRTAIEENLGRDVILTPLRKGILDGFIPHNSVHDCASAVLQLIYSRRYAFGLEEVPTGDDVDPLTIMKKRN